MAKNELKMCLAINIFDKHFCLSSYKIDIIGLSGKIYLIRQFNPAIRQIWQDSGKLIGNGIRQKI